MFGTSGIRGPVGETVTAELALSVGQAVASDGSEHIVIGRDPRSSGQMLAEAVSAGARACGADVDRVGIASTPTIARAVGWQNADAGVVITASHNPPDDNGLKLWTPSGRAFNASQRNRISERIQTDSYEYVSANAVGDERSVSTIVDRHRAALTEAVDQIDDLEVVLDLGNGAGRVTADALTALGCSVTTLNGQPDGSFPGRPSEPTAENCQALSSYVAESTADLGLAHDGDADRLMAVTGEGTFVPGDVLLALFAREIAGAGDHVAVPVNTSLAVDDTLAEVGASVVRTRVGDVYVAERATEPDVVFGGEPSGAWIWPDETLCPDGPLAACRLAALVADKGPLAALVSDIETYPIERTSIAVDDKAVTMQRVGAILRERYSSDRLTDDDGIRVDFDEGWLLIRPSGTEPVVRVTAEARTSERATELRDSGVDILAEHQTPRT